MVSESDKIGFNQYKSINTLPLHRHNMALSDLQDSEASGTVTADYSGTSFLPALVIPIPLIARTRSKACNGLANQLKLFIVSDEAV